MPKRGSDRHAIETDPLRHVYKRVPSENVSRRHAGCTFAPGEVRDIIRDAKEEHGHAIGRRRNPRKKPANTASSPPLQDRRGEPCYRA